MKRDIQVALPGRIYEMHDGEWQEVQPRSTTRVGSALHGLAALFATAFAVAAIAVIGIVATAVALVLYPFALLTAWRLRASTAQGMKKGRSP
jgi:hypothetical protein